MKLELGKKYIAKNKHTVLIDTYNPELFAPYGNSFWGLYFHGDGRNVGVCNNGEWDLIEEVGHSSINLLSEKEWRKERIFALIHVIHETSKKGEKLSPEWLPELKQRLNEYNLFES